MTEIEDDWEGARDRKNKKKELCNKQYKRRKGKVIRKNERER